MIDADKIATEKEIKTWYERNEKTFLDVAILTYAGESITIQQLYVPLKDDKWIILDIKVFPDNNVTKMDVFTLYRN